MIDFLGISEDKENEDWLYRLLDHLWSHKTALERHLKEKLGDLLDLRYGCLLYGFTWTYFEGKAMANLQAQRGEDLWRAYA